MSVGLATACDAQPQTWVILDNAYPADAASPVTVVAAQWQLRFPGPVAAGQSSDAQAVVPSDTTMAYAVLAPGWDASSDGAPTRMVVVESNAPYAVHLNDTLHVVVDDATFSGNCDAHRPLPSQAEADFITQVVFPDVFVGARYDAATCRTTPLADAGAP